jgi:hypothetical protein
MKVERLTIATCSACTKPTIIFKIDRPLSAELLTFLVNKGFVEDAKFTKVGLLYVDNPDFILTGALGQNKLTAKCKMQDCTQKLNELEGLLLQME